MYKKRFKAWRLTKNYGKAVLGLQARAEALGVVAMVNNKPIDMQKLSRYNRRRGQRRAAVAPALHTRKRHSQSTRPHILLESRETSSDAAPSQNESVTVICGNTSVMRQTYWPSSRSSLISQRSLANRNSMESLLWTTSSYFEMYFQRSEPDHWLRRQDDLYVIGLIENAKLSQRDEVTRALSLINIACGHFKSLLQTQPIMLISRLLVVFRDRKWANWLDLRSRLLRFFASMAQVSLGSAHLLTRVLFLLAEPEVIDDGNLAFLELFSDTISRCLPIGIQGWVYLRFEIINELIEKRELALAESHCNIVEALANTEVLEQGLHPGDDEAHWCRTAIIRYRAWICQQQSRHDEAEQLYQKVLSLNDEYYHIPAFNNAGVHASNALGQMAEDRCDWEEAEKYYYYALENAVRDSAVDHYEVLFYFQSLERVYLTQGKIDDVDDLYCWAGHIVDYWDERIRESDPTMGRDTTNKQLKTGRWKAFYIRGPTKCNYQRPHGALPMRGLPAWNYFPGTTNSDQQYVECM
jgi:tetratricopeptide (TPR) repeat protein